MKSAHVALAALVLAGLPAAAVADGPQSRGGPPLRALEIEVVSSLPEFVSGGDALIEISAPPGTAPPHVRVEVDGERRDVKLEWADDRRVLVGVVDGLEPGAHTITATAPRGREASVEVVNHPGEGPLFAGPHEEPFICQTADFTLPVIGGTLGAPLDENCSTATRVDYFYRTDDGAYAPWPAGARRYPADLARTTTSDGDRVPFIVRMETGTANRGIYQHTVLHDPLREVDPSPAHRPKGWNGRAIYTLGGGCTGGWFRQGETTGGVTDAWMLGQGYAVVSSSLNVFGQNCNDLLASETAAMTKEKFIEVYGREDFTIGFGCSGGSYQAHQTADNYPGIFDGIVVGCSFPEVGFGTVNYITDARLLDHYFAGADVAWSDEQKRAVTGFAHLVTMTHVVNGAQRIDPTVFCPSQLPVELRYHPTDNPDGARCDVYDHTVNAYGRDPETGFALRPLDNEGIQYGLRALEDGTITPTQFLDLNEHVGGYDDDGKFRVERSEADMPAVEAAYRTGRLTNGGGGLASTPIIDYRAYSDDLPGGDIHVRYHSNSMRERLRDANGSVASHVSLLEDNRYGGFSTASPLLRHAVTQMDAWLSALDLEGEERPSLEEISETRPESLVEGCMTREANPTFIAEPLDRDPATECEQLYPSASFPREVAGEGVQADVIKCQTREPRREDYGVEFTDAEWQRLTTIFADGVCDYSVPGQGQQGLAGTWLRIGSVS